jgi:hypothetical protein
MYYVKIEDGTPVGYPVTERTLREMNPNVSFPYPIKPEDLRPLGYALFQRALPPEVTRFQVVQDSAPFYDGTIVTQQFEVRDMGEQEILAVRNQTEDDAKATQRRMLLDSDWTELPSVQSKHTEEWIAAWAEYRTLLRDVDKQESWPFDLNWPKAPLVAN